LFCFIKLVILIQLFILIFIFHKNNCLDNINIKIIILIFISTLGLFMALNATDFMLLYLSIEFSSIPIYIMVSNKQFIINIESGIKYYIFSAIISFFFLFGISILYGMVGSLNFYYIYIFQLCSNNYENYYLFIIFIFIISLFLFKIGIFPFHYWITNFNEGASLNIVLYLSIVPKLSYFYILLNILFVVFNPTTFSFYIIYILIFFCIITIIIAIVEGLLEYNLGRIFGQSSIINMAFVFIVFLCLSMIEEFYLFYIFFLYLIPTLLFFCILSLTDYYNYRKDIYIIGIFSIYNKYLLWIVYLIFISLAGLPFLINFLGKWYILKVLMDYGYWVIVGILIFLGIFINIFYLRLFYYIIKRNRSINLKIQLFSYLKYYIIIFLFFLNNLVLFFHESLVVYLFSLL